MLQVFCSIGCSAKQVIVMSRRLAEEVTVRLKVTAPLLILLSAGKDNWASGVPPAHLH